MFQFEHLAEQGQAFTKMLPTQNQHCQLNTKEALLLNATIKNEALRVIASANYSFKMQSFGKLFYGDESQQSPDSSYPNIS